MSATINTFPPLHALNSRSWFMAAIVLLHAGFFWVLSNGLSLQIVDILPPLKVVVPEPDPKPQPKVTKIKDPTELDRWKIVVPEPKTNLDVEREDVIFAERVAEKIVEATPIEAGSGQGVEPIVVEPSIDQRYGFSEPIYPASAIRAEQEGTVWLSVRVGANGRVLEIKLDRSSGHGVLDQSAMREARRWRFVAGTEDGRPTPMWTKIPVTFRLQ